MFYCRFPYFGKFWSYCCLIFHWLSVKLKKEYPLFIVSFWSDLDGIPDHLDIFTLGRCFCNCCWMFWVGPDWSGQVSLISLVFRCLCCCQSTQKPLLSFLPIERFSASKVEFSQASNCCKRPLEPANPPYSNKTKESITSQKLSSYDFWEIAHMFVTKVNLLYLLYLMAQRSYLCIW